MADSMRGPGLINMDFSGHKAVEQEAINQPLAREHAAHISGTNEQKEYITTFPAVGKLGARGHAGN